MKERIFKVVMVEVKRQKMICLETAVITVFCVSRATAVDVEAR